MKNLIINIIFFTITILSINHPNVALAGNKIELGMEDQGTSSISSYAANPPQLLTDITKDLEALEPKVTTVNHVIDMVMISTFYFQNAAAISSMLTPKENEVKAAYLRRMKTRAHLEGMNKIIGNTPHITQITLLKPEELAQLYSKFDRSKINQIIKEKCEMPFQSLVYAYTHIAKEKLPEFFKVAFIEGCIAKKTTKLSKWASKNINLN